VQVAGCVNERLLSRGKRMSGRAVGGRADPNLIQSGGAAGAGSRSALLCGSCTLVT
jgi:hypothetical protein